MRVTEIIDMLYEKTASTRWAREFTKAVDAAKSAKPNSAEQEKAVGSVNNIYYAMRSKSGFPKSDMPYFPKSDMPYFARTKGPGGNTDKVQKYYDQGYFNWLDGKYYPMGKVTGTLNFGRKNRELIAPAMRPITKQKEKDSLQSKVLQHKLVEYRKTPQGKNVMKANKLSDDRSSGDIGRIVSSYQK